MQDPEDLPASRKENRGPLLDLKQKTASHRKPSGKSSGLSEIKPSEGTASRREPRGKDRGSKDTRNDQPPLPTQGSQERSSNNKSSSKPEEPLPQKNGSLKGPPSKSTSLQRVFQDRNEASKAKSTETSQKDTSPTAKHAQVLGCQPIC